MPPTFYVYLYSVLRHFFTDIMVQCKVHLGERSDRTVLADEVGPAVLLSDGQVVTWGWVCVVQEMGVSGHSAPYWDY